MDRLDDHIQQMQARAKYEARALLGEKPDVKFVRFISDPHEPLHLVVEDNDDRLLLMALGTGMRFAPTTTAHRHEIEFVNP